MLYGAGLERKEAETLCKRKRKGKCERERKGQELNKKPCDVRADNGIPVWTAETRLKFSVIFLSTFTQMYK